MYGWQYRFNCLYFIPNLANQISAQISNSGWSRDPGTVYHASTNIIDWIFNRPLFDMQFRDCGRSSRKELCSSKHLQLVQVQFEARVASCFDEMTQISRIDMNAARQTWRLDWVTRNLTSFLAALWFLFFSLEIVTDNVKFSFYFKSIVNRTPVSEEFARESVAPKIVCRKMYWVSPLKTTSRPIGES